MISNIEISNFAIIENASIELSGGFNVFTGETGSGKSIVITAISLAIGSRADSSYVRSGKEKATVSIIGSINGQDTVISRQISKSGRNICKVDGRLVTLSELAETCQQIADIHGQYDNQSLLNSDNHISILDNYAKDSLSSHKEAYKKLYATYLDTKTKLDKLLNSEKSMLQKLDFYSFAIDEIDRANLKLNEDKILAEHLSLLKNGEKISSATSKAYQLLDGDSGALSNLGRAIDQLNDIRTYSSELETLSDDASDIYYKLEDISSMIRNTIDSMTFSTDDIDETIERIALIDRLKHKYADSIEGILNYRNSIFAERSQLENFDYEKDKLAAQLQAQHVELLKKATEISNIRKDKAAELSSKIIKELCDLNFEKAQFSIEFTNLNEPTVNGIDIAEMMISTNPGEPLKSLGKTASGGEISRIMLAIKKITASCDNIPTLIFDEIDQGISGRTASIVGRKLKEISSHHQVICITHLPQIAASADHNYKIAKKVIGEKTYTDIEKLNYDAKVDEIARLLGGEHITEMARKNALELIKLS